MNRRLFLDLDGVLADFDGGYEQFFGIKPDKLDASAAFWQRVDDHGSFYLDLQPMPDAYFLWERCQPWSPTILTGIPRTRNAAEHKAAWVKRHFGAHAKLICCLSRNKRDHMQAGDVLVDDWDKYRHLWEEKGGIFILHTSAHESLQQLRRIFP